MPHGSIPKLLRAVGCDMHCAALRYSRIILGYTPAECAVLGVPSITSNLAGFGSYMEKHLPNPGRLTTQRRLRWYCFVCSTSRHSHRRSCVVDVGAIGAADCKHFVAIHASESMLFWIVKRFLTFVQLSRRQRIELRNRVERLSGYLDWKVIVCFEISSSLNHIIDRV